MNDYIMKLSFKSAVVCTLALAACASSPIKNTASAPSQASTMTASETKAETASVTVNVTGFDVTEGYVMAALVDAEGYKGGKPLQGKRVAVTGDAVSMTFSALVAGEYAIRMYHDKNDDGEMNTNAFGIPTEPFAFSNNATGMMGPAPWSKAKFNVSGDTVQNISF